MSSKDMRFYRNCPICDDRLVGTDDGLEVFETIKSDLAEAPEGDSCCTLCGKTITNKRARIIIAIGEPELRNA